MISAFRALAAWKQYAIGGAVLIALMTGFYAYSYSAGYSSGSDDKEKELVKAHNEALADQLVKLEAMHAKTVTALKGRSDRERQAERIAEAPRPIADPCNAGTDWLHHIQDSIDSANGIAGADAGTTPND